MSRLKALKALGALKADQTEYQAARGFSVTADACFFFWEDELQQHDESHWTVTRATDDGLIGWAATPQGASFYRQLLAAHKSHTPVRVALNRMAGNAENGDRLTGDGANPILWTDGTPAYGEIIDLDVTDFCVSIRFAPPASVALPEMLVVEDTFKREVAKSLSRSQSDRIARLRQTSPTPATIQVVSTVYVRNSDVVAEVLFNAKGRCGSCRSQAPFDRKSNGQPYLEVHHNVPLAAGGQDTVDNAVALCPNCHRRAHYG